MRLRYLLRFAIGGDLRFISHRDTIRLFERVLVRAGLPVRYSEGFNPRLRLWLPLPRSLGTSADDEVLMIEATEKLKTEEALARLQDRSPIGLQVRSLQLMESSARPRPMRAYYELPLGQEYRRPAETDAQTDVGVDHDRRMMLDVVRQHRCRDQADKSDQPVSGMLHDKLLTAPRAAVS